MQQQPYYRAPMSKQSESFVPLPAPGLLQTFGQAPQKQSFRPQELQLNFQAASTPIDRKKRKFAKKSSKNGLARTSKFQQP